jgi:hypothetical protein
MHNTHILKQLNTNRTKQHNNNHKHHINTSKITYVTQYINTSNTNHIHVHRQSNKHKDHKNPIIKHIQIIDNNTQT